MLVPTIGIEVHVELKTKTKVFSNSLNEFNSSINNNVNPIDIALPGTLPIINKEVINCALKAALALNCKINKRMHFDRKNYFYPDLSKGYQITQKDTPIGYDGYVEILVDGKTKKIEIERIHIEEDTCKSIHTDKETLLNYNRSGVPLIEIVTKPTIKDGIEAMTYLETLREILLYLGVSDVKIEEGSMRCDANVSLHEENSDIFGVKTEIKNIGSISNVALSINYEIERQKEIINSGGTVVEQTRRFDDKTNETVLMRKKEVGNEYRYLPEPDIPYIEIDDYWINSIKENMPVLPSVLKKKYFDLGVNSNNIKTIINNIDLCNFLEKLDNCNIVIASNLLTGEVLSYLNKNRVKIYETNLNYNNFKELVNLLEENKISSNQGKEILNILLKNGGITSEIIKKLGFEQIIDESKLLDVIKNVIDNNPLSVKDYKDGKDRAIKYLMGQIMKETKGQANPKLLNELLIKELNRFN